MKFRNESKLPLIITTGDFEIIDNSKFSNLIIQSENYQTDCFQLIKPSKPLIFNNEF